MESGKSKGKERQRSYDPEWNAGWQGSKGTLENSERWTGKHVERKFTHVWIDIPWWTRGMLIGKNGEKLNEIRELSKVQRGYLPPDTYGIYLKGTREQVEIAENEFYRLLKSVKTEIMSTGLESACEVETLILPPKWPVDALWTNSSLAEVQVIRRWKCDRTNHEEPEWDNEVFTAETLVCIRASSAQMPAALLALNPRTELKIVIPNIVYDLLSKLIVSRPGIVDWSDEPHDDGNRILRGRGVDGVMRQVAKLVFSTLRETRTTDRGLRLLDIKPDHIRAIGRRGIEEAVRKLQAATGVSIRWIQASWCYGEEWIVDEDEESMLVLSGENQAVAIMETKLNQLLQISFPYSNDAIVYYLDPRSNSPCMLQDKGLNPFAEPFCPGYLPVDFDAHTPRASQRLFEDVTPQAAIKFQ